MLTGAAASSSAASSAASADEVALLLNPNSDGKFLSESIVDTGEAGVSSEDARRRRGLLGVAGTCWNGRQPSRRYRIVLCLDYRLTSQLSGC